MYTFRQALKSGLFRQGCKLDSNVPDIFLDFSCQLPLVKFQEKGRVSLCENNTAGKYPLDSQRASGRSSEASPLA